MTQQYHIGMVGLGTMGRSMVLNMADHGFTVAGYDKDSAKGKDLLAEGEGKSVGAASDPAEFVAMLEKPRAILLLVAPAKVVGLVLKDLLPLVEPGDLIIDAGNAYFKDTDANAKTCAEKGVHFFGMGVSGGEAGARHGPSMMPGGPKEAYERVRPVLEAIAAKVNNEPCVTWLGNGSAGHYVKMVHNGIEYGIMQMIAEVYDILRRGLNMPNDEMHQVFDGWNKGALNSFLVEITAQVLIKKDDKGGSGFLVDKIKDIARQKGTGKWTSQDALDLQVPVPTIDLAVTARDLSGMADERAAVAKALGSPIALFAGQRQPFLIEVGLALQAAIMLTYAQGMDLLRVASKEYHYGLNLADVSRIWRGGCIIRSAFLEDMRAAYAANANLPSLIADDKIAGKVRQTHAGLRSVVKTAIEMGIPTPCLMGSLSYLDSLRCGSLPTNLIQSQRDFFGAHTYERIDATGTFHSHWDQA